MNIISKQFILKYSRDPVVEYNIDHIYFHKIYFSGKPYYYILSSKSYYLNLSGYRHNIGYSYFGLPVEIQYGPCSMMEDMNMKRNFWYMREHEYWEVNRVNVYTIVGGYFTKFNKDN